MKTRRMFLVALCGVAMLIGASSCKKEKQENENGETMTIKASLSSVDNNSKTHLEGKKVMWDMGDAFKLFRTVSTESTKFSLTRIDETDGKVAYFEGKHPGDAPYYACYPFNNVSCTTAGTFTFSIPQVQNDSPETVSDNSNAGPMVGFMEKASGSLVFQNAMSWLKVGLKGNAIIKRVVLTDNSPSPANKMLNGTLTVTCSGNTKSTFDFETAMSGGTNQLEIVSSTGIALGDDYRPFWFLVPKGSLESLELCVYVSDAAEATPVLTLNKQISGGMQENTILSANVTSTPVNYTSPTLTLQICKNCKQTILGNYTAGVPTTAKFGVCYVETTSGTEIPTIEDTKVEIGTLTATGDYQADLDTDLGLDHSKMYRVRTYVDNGVVTYSDKVYTVDWPRPLPSSWTNGKSPKQFSVSATKKVYFSQGNLQYTTTGSHSVAGGGTATGTWRFAEHQFDFIGADNANAAQTYGGWIDLFGWGTSGYHQSTDSYNKNYQPWATSTSTVNTSYNYYGYGPSTDVTPVGSSGMTQSQGNISGSYYDWGVNCAISNGGNQAGKWRTLTGGSSGNGEWYYLINSRSDAANLYGEGKVGNCTPGLIILPDDWKWEGDVAEFGPSVTEESRRWKPGKTAWSNVYSYSEWAKMEAAGAVFLPAAGNRTGTSVDHVGSDGLYWSSSSYSDSFNAYDLYFGSGSVLPSSYSDRCNGFSVRLVSEN